VRKCESGETAGGGARLGGALLLGGLALWSVTCSAGAVSVPLVAPEPAVAAATPVTGAWDPGVLLADNTAGNPATEADRAAADSPHRHVSTYDMAPLVVQGTRYSPYADDQLIGDYAQPRWTAQRLFPGTRVYVIPRGEIDIEQWYRWETPKNGAPTTLTAQTEIEWGLPHRLQLDVYLIQQRETGVPGSGSTGNSIEMRYAFADWGKLWGNPALYLEHTSQTGMPDKVEGKLLLADELGAGWHWGANLSVEQQTSGTRTTERQFTLGIARTVRDRQLSLGAETRLGWTDQKGSRRHYARDLQVGPSVQFRPLTQMHVDFAPLFGITSDSMQRNVYLIFGWEF
jgi:hypothetical protein